jgi:tryptophanyl-tRNA synthetase
MKMIWDLETAKRHHRRSPGIAERLCELLPRDEAVLDLGCGPGYYLSVLAERGFRCLGVEGTPSIGAIADYANIVQADLSQPLTIDWPRSTVLCLEVAEHVFARFEGTLLENIDRYCSRTVVISWAVPGQRGRGHVNCRPNSYVYEQFRRRGFELRPDMTFALREAAEDTVKYFRNTLLAFERT